MTMVNWTETNTFMHKPAPPPTPIDSLEIFAWRLFNLINSESKTLKKPKPILTIGHRREQLYAVLGL